MIPLRLRLKNFLGYRNEQELSLEGIRLACLSGDNGAGKSSLLDAMTWALWGQSRAKTSDDLVHLGQIEMEVELEFGVGVGISKDGAARYRVLRKHRRGAPGHPSQSILELYIAGITTSPYDWKTISGNGVRDTQYKIEDILKLDYDTFINSAFIRQGRADEFTIKTPAKRKELLAEILGLSFYETLEKKARDKRIEAANQIIVLDSEIENLVRELTLKSVHEAEMLRAQEELAKLEPQIRLQEAAVAGLREKLGELQAKKLEAEQVGLSLQPVRKELGAMQVRQQEHNLRIEGYERLLNERAAIETGYGELQQSRKDAEVWSSKLQALNALQQKQNRLEHLIKDARAIVEREIALIKHEVNALEQKSAALPGLQKAFAALQFRLTELQTEESSLLERRQGVQRLREETNLLQVICGQIETELQQASQHMTETGKRLQAAQSRRDDHTRLINEYEVLVVQRTEIEEGYMRLQQARVDADLWSDKLAKINALQTETNRLERLIAAARAVLEREHALVTQKVSELGSKSDALPELRESLSKTHNGLKLLETRELGAKQKREHTQELRDMINSLQAEYDQLGKDTSSSKEKLALLASGDAHCPLCETDLGIEGKERLETRYRQEIEAKTAARAATQMSLKNTQTRYLSLINELKLEEDQTSREMSRARAQLASLENDVDSARQAEEMLAIEQGKLSQVQMRLSANEYARPEQELMGKLTVEIETVGYDKSKHQAVREGLSELVSYETRKRQLDETEIRIQAERQSLSQILDSIKELLGQQQTFEKRQGELKAELGSKSKRLAEVKRDYLSLAQAVDDAEKGWNSEKSRTTTQLAMTEKDMKQAEEARVALPAERDKLTEKENCMAKHEYAQSEQRDLDDTMMEIRALGYDQSSHQETKKRLLSLETFETRKRQLDEAQVRIETERLSLSRTVETLAQQENQIRGLEARERYLSVELSVLPEVVSKLRGAEELCRALLVQERGCREKIAVSQEGINRCKALEQAKSEKEVLRDEDARQEGIYRELAEAFGKKGVPALLIEAALPEIEIEANRLLSRMTDNRLNIKLETQRDSKVKKGDPIETLDIKISDELGTRDYEMYSGGEAFRINLALRIALSKLLARRSGAPLPTLVIDEGFGTQDSNGREKLVEAINSIQGDFEKILVITHIEELKDLFPVRIEVTKTSEGSTFRVVE